jgi:putative Mn2+ efflux pump MntP
MYLKERLFYIFIMLLLGIFEIIFFVFQNYVMLILGFVFALIIGLYAIIKKVLLEEKRMKENHDNLEKIANKN